MIEYRKYMNRSLSILGCQYWEKGERIAQLAMCNGVFFAEPMFVYVPGGGVGVHYNWVDPRQDPERLVEYFNTHPDAFDPLAKEYLQHCATVDEIILRNDPVDFDKLFDELVAMWPMLVVVNILGAWDRSALLPEIGQKCFNLRSQTDTVYYRADEVLADMAKKISGSDDVDFLTKEEINGGTFVSAEELEKRKRGFVYFKGRLTTEPLGNVLRENDIEILAPSTYETSEVVGNSASGGVVRGTVRVVFERAHMERVQSGDILVMPMTTPDFMPAIRLAGAIVTDEGGITCHAAIVARELKKPCVIGTKTATRILKDGDLVEVDAERGVIRKINS